MSMTESTTEIFGKLMGYIIGITFLTLVRAFVVIKFWAWFVLVIFPTFHSLTYPTAIGLSMLVSFMTMHSTNKDAKIDWVLVYTYPLVTLGMGWIVTLFM